MKKMLTIVLLVVTSFSSCKKENLNPKPCNCGTVTRAGIYGDSISSFNSTQNGVVVIQNDCSGKRDLFIISPTDWILVSDSNHVEGTWNIYGKIDYYTPPFRTGSHVCLVKYTCPFQLNKTIISSSELNDCFTNAPEWKFY
jgi:hypothetical protein